MRSKRFVRLAEGYEQDVVTIVENVLSLEQRHISMDRPRVKDEIDAIVERVARKRLENANSARSSSDDT